MEQDILSLISEKTAEEIVDMKLVEEETTYPGITKFHREIYKHAQFDKLDYSLTGDDPEKKKFLEQLLKIGLVIRPDHSAYSKVMVLSREVYTAKLLQSRKSSQRPKSKIDYLGDDDGSDNPVKNVEVYKKPEKTNKESANQVPLLKSNKKTKKLTAVDEKTVVEALKKKLTECGYPTAKLDKLDLILIYALECLEHPQPQSQPYQQRIIANKFPREATLYGFQDKVNNLVDGRPVPYLPVWIGKIAKNGFLKIEWSRPLIISITQKGREEVERLKSSTDILELEKNTDTTSLKIPEIKNLESPTKKILELLASDFLNALEIANNGLPDKAKVEQLNIELKTILKRFETLKNQISLDSSQTTTTT